MLDHKETAQQLDIDAQQIRIIQNQFCTTLASNRLCKGIIENIEGLADWHHKKAKEQQDDFDSLMLAHAAND